MAQISTNKFASLANQVALNDAIENPKSNMDTTVVENVLAKQKDTSKDDQKYNSQTALQQSLKSSDDLSAAIEKDRENIKHESQSAAQTSSKSTQGTEEQAKKAVESITKKPEALDPALVNAAVQTYEVDIPIPRSDSPPPAAEQDSAPAASEAPKEAPKSTEAVKPKEQETQPVKKETKAQPAESAVQKPQ